MIRYIAVFTSQLNRRNWNAVQWGPTEDSVVSNPFYIAGYATIMPKNPEDELLGIKTITERTTQRQVTVQVVKLSQSTFESLTIPSNSSN